MFIELEPSYIGKPFPLPEIPCADEDQSGEISLGKARFIKKKPYCWLFKGSVLAVFNCGEDSKPSLVSSMDFARLYEDKTITITCITQLKDHVYSMQKPDYPFNLLIALNRSSQGSILCLVDARRHVIIKSIECPFKITCLECISSYSSYNQSLLFACDELLIMCGIVALGTQGGLIFFVDLCLDRQSDDNEILPPYKITFIVKQSNNTANYDLNSKRKSSLVNDQHICFPLNNESQQKGKFMYRSEGFVTLGSFRTSKVLVTALKFVPQTNTLYAGFNFGGFQFWDLKTLKLECSCGLEADLAPVIKFDIQEPQDDPVNYCYTWVVRGVYSGNANRSPLEESIPTTASLYCLQYGKKEWTTGYGYLYSEFISCSCKFDYQMSMNPYAAEPPEATSSCLINMYTIEQGTLFPFKCQEDERDTFDTNLCVIAWEAWDYQVYFSSRFFLAIFDLNQWYRTQMPKSVELNGAGASFCPYLGVFSLTELSNILSPDVLFDVRINEESIMKFREAGNCHELHDYPSSLSLEAQILTQNQIITTKYLGIQRKCLLQLSTIGPNVFIDPKEYLSTCFLSGLLASDQALELNTNETRREALLSLAFKNDQLPFLIKTIQHWASGDFSRAGCDCKFFLNWIWNQVTQIKQSIDEITLPLFDGSGQALNDFNLGKLSCFEIEIKSLSLLLKTLRFQGAPTTEQGLLELEMRKNVTHLIGLYLRVILWSYHCNLLPETFSEIDDSEALYPRESLSRKYNEWRREYLNLNPSLNKLTSVLIIDGIIQNLPSVSNLWKERGGDGLYPPPSIYAVIGIYLLEDVSIALKHQIMLYFLSDIAFYSIEKTIQVTEKIKLFPAAFNLKQGFTKLIEGIWAIDHQLFDFGIKALFHPEVKSALDSHNAPAELVNDMRRRIMISLLYQERHFDALKLITTLNILELNSHENEKLYLSILLRNKQLLKAFKFQRSRRNENNVEDLLIHFYLACEQMNLMSEVFKFPLDSIEEDGLIYYLLNISTLPSSKHLLGLYFLLNNKIIEAHQFREKYEEELENVEDERLYQLTMQLSSLIDAHLAVLPKSLTKFANEINLVENEKLKNDYKLSEATKDDFTITRVPGCSDIMLKVIKEIEELKNTNAEKLASPSTPFHQKIKQKGLLLTKDSPFLRTPINRISPKLLSSFSETPVLGPVFASTTKTSQKVTPLKKNIPSEILSLLSTPQIKRMTKTQEYSCFTPVSILKNKNTTFDSAMDSPFIPSKKVHQDASLRFKTPSPSDDNSNDAFGMKSYKDTMALVGRDIPMDECDFTFSQPHGLEQDIDDSISNPLSISDKGSDSSRQDKKTKKKSERKSKDATPTHHMVTRSARKKNDTACFASDV